MNDAEKKFLADIYYNAKKGASFSGPWKLYNAAKLDGRFNVKFKDVKKWLADQEIYSLFKKPNRKFKRERVIPAGLNDLWQADLAQLEQIKRENSGVTFLLVCIDVFSRFAFVEPLKTKTSKEVAGAMEKILARASGKPNILSTDRGGEFMGKEFQQVLKTAEIKHFGIYSDKKAGSAERCVRSIKDRIFKYIVYTNNTRYLEELPLIVQGYNSTVNTATDIAPKDVNSENEDWLWWQIYKPNDDEHTKKRRRVANFDIGDHVRISLLQGKFDRAYDQTFSREIFVIDQKFRRNGFEKYRLKDLAGEEIKGAFYGAELSLTKYDPNAAYKIEKIVKTRKLKGKEKEHLVKFLGYPDSMNQWIKASDMHDA